MTKWHSTEKVPAPQRFEREDEKLLTARVLVAVEHAKEPCKGTCIKREGRPFKWQADGHYGTVNVYAWAILPELPPVPFDD